MGLSKVELSNQALDHLGKDRIASLTENSTAARKLNEVFDRTLSSALARSHWTFSRKIAALASVTNDWEERWAYKYDEPNDAVTVVRVVPRADIQNNEPQIPHQRMGGAIYTNEVDAKIEYVFDNTSTITMPTLFLDAVSFLLARNVCMPLTRKRALWQDMNEAYEWAVGLAVEHDAGQEPTFYPQAGGGEWISARGASPDTHVEGAAVDGSIYWS